MGATWNEVPREEPKQPEVEKEYLVRNADNNFFVAEWRIAGVWRDKHADCWVYHVTHWMEIPEFPGKDADD